MSNADDRNKDFWDKVDEMDPVASDDTEFAVEDSPDVAAGAAAGAVDVPGDSGLDVGAVGVATARNADEPTVPVDPDPERPIVDPDRPIF